MYNKADSSKIKDKLWAHLVSMTGSWLEEVGMDSVDKKQVLTGLFAGHCDQGETVILKFDRIRGSNLFSEEGATAKMKTK